MKKEKIMTYPYNILNEDIYPLFDNQVTGLPLYINVVGAKPMSAEEAIEWRFGEIKKAGRQWGYSGYLEDNSKQLKSKTVFDGGRFMHLGIDLHVYLGIKLHAPLEGKVVVSEYEEGAGNYGGMTVLEHNVNGSVFYSLYGHLSVKDLPKLGAIIKKGEAFASIGDVHENGNWAYHTHMQVLTEEGYNNGWVHKGFCTVADLTSIYKLCPDPSFLIRYRS